MAPQKSLDGTGINTSEHLSVAVQQTSLRPKSVLKCIYSEPLYSLTGHPKKCLIIEVLTKSHIIMLEADLGNVALVVGGIMLSYNS